MLAQATEEFLEGNTLNIYAMIMTVAVIFLGIALAFERQCRKVAEEERSSANGKLGSHDKLLHETQDQVSQALDQSTRATEQATRWHRRCQELCENLDTLEKVRDGQIMEIKDLRTDLNNEHEARKKEVQCLDQDMRRLIQKVEDLVGERDQLSGKCLALCDELARIRKLSNDMREVAMQMAIPSQVEREAQASGVILQPEASPWGPGSNKFYGTGEDGVSGWVSPPGE